MVPIGFSPYGSRAEVAPKVSELLVPLWFHWFHFGIQYKNATVEAFSGGGKIMNEIPNICTIATKLCDISNLRGYTYI